MNSSMRLFVATALLFMFMLIFSTGMVAEAQICFGKTVLGICTGTGTGPICTQTCKDSWKEGYFGGNCQGKYPGICTCQSSCDPPAGCDSNTIKDDIPSCRLCSNCSSSSCYESCCNTLTSDSSCKYNYECIEFCKNTEGLVSGFCDPDSKTCTCKTC